MDGTTFYGGHNLSGNSQAVKLKARHWGLNFPIQKRFFKEKLKQGGQKTRNLLDYQKGLLKKLSILTWDWRECSG